MMSSFISQILNFALGAARSSVWLVLLVCIFVPLELLFALHPRKIWRRQFTVDLAWYFINSLLPAAILAFPLMIMTRLLSGLDPGGLYTAVGSWPLWLRLSLALFVGDMGAYWIHRAFHTFPLLWKFHAIHHSSDELDWLVNTRAHPFEIVATRMFSLLPVYLLGLAQVGPRVDPIVLWVQIAGTIWTFFIHANVKFRFGPLEWLVSTPAFHHWHHTNDENRNHNFSSIFPVIDKMFGTAWLPQYWPPEYGIKAKLPESLYGQFLEPLAPTSQRESRGKSTLDESVAEVENGDQSRRHKKL